MPRKGSRYAVVSTWGFMWTNFVLGIPVIGFILALVWAFGKGNMNRRNLARSWLVYMLIGIGFAVIMYVLALIFASTFGGWLDGVPDWLSFLR